MIQNSKFQTTSTELDVTKTSFINCYSKGKGGSISIISPCTFSCVETRFINSSSSESGGAIYGLIKKMILSNICFLNCSTTDNGQANYISCIDESVQVNISHTTIALCSKYKRGMNQNGNHFQNGVISFNEANISKSITTRGAAAISTQKSSVSLISYSNIQDCVSISILDFFFTPHPVTIDHTNFIANSNTAQSNLLVFSSNTVLSSCYFERNKGYLTGPSAGPTISIVMKDCYYDLIKFLISSGVQTENCQLIGEHAKPNTIGKQGDACIDEKSLKLSSSTNYLPYLLYLAGIASIIYVLVFKFHSIVLLLSKLPGRTRSHTRTRPITHYHV